MSDATIAVRGSWRAEVPPEVAHVHVAVRARGSDRRQVLRDLAGRLDGLRAVVAGYGDAVEQLEGGALWVRPQVTDGRRERLTHVAGSHLTVTVVDATVLGDLVLRLADGDLVTVEGPFWALRPGSEVYRRARMEAVRDARRRAEEYAAAAGARLTGLVELSDLGAHTSVPLAAGASRPAGAVADEVHLDVQPAPQTVSATVEARFTCTQPDF